jgi:tRNA pseudouridine55 synthase
LHASKSYRGVMVLGVETDSQDATGKILQVRAVPPIGTAELKSLEQQFFGDLQQVPPMFSALKRRGVPLYRLARQGREVPREPRAIRIEKLWLNRLTQDEIEIELTCSRGTYVRTLVADMGKSLGCGAHLKSLRRTACGHLHVDQSLTLDELERLNSREVRLLALEKVLEPLHAIVWDNHLVSRLRLGQQEVLRALAEPARGERLARILDSGGTLVGLVEWIEEIPRGRWRLVRVFHG